MAHPAHLVLLEKLEPTEKPAHLATQAQKANPAATDSPVHLVPTENPVLPARTARLDHPVRMDPKEPRVPTDHPARPVQLDQRETRDPTAPQEMLANPADLDQLESLDRPETPDHPDQPVSPDLRENPARMPSTARARAALSSTRSRRLKQHQKQSHQFSSQLSIDTTVTLSSVLYFIFQWCWPTQSLRSICS